MAPTEKIINTYTNILKGELAVAMGCTEPIAIAYSASILRHALGELPTSLRIGLSGNIIKNVKSVIVPATSGMKGIPAAVSAGIIAGCPERKLEVLCALTEDDAPKIKSFAENTPLEIYELCSSVPFEIFLEGKSKSHEASVHLKDRHTSIQKVIADGCDLTEKYYNGEVTKVVYNADRELLTVKDIIDFADNADLTELTPYLERQLEMNMAIAKAGLEEKYGASIGRIMYADGNCSLRDRACAYAAAGSDARMNGCELPVCIISGSGNQGITASVPLVIYAEDMGADHQTLLRALLVSDLITIHQKTGIGCLSAYCGAISAGCGCGCGICYLNGGRVYEISHTLVNSLAILSGTICDGAKASCAAKIAMAVQAGVLGYEMMKAGSQFYGGDGIIKKGVENTIKNVGRLARDGMSETDKEIIKIMLS